jgi:hypothetical protein
VFLGASPDCGLDDALSQSPGEEGDDEQLGEQDARHGVAQTEQRDAEDERHEGADVPQHLGQARDAAPALAGRRLGDERPRGGHVGADGQPDHEVAEDQHPGCLGENDPEHPERVEQQVPLVDLLAAEPVTDPAADQGTQSGGDRIGTERAEQRHEARPEAERFGPDGERHGTGDDRAGIDVVRHRREDGLAPLLAAHLLLPHTGCVYP